MTITIPQTTDRPESSCLRLFYQPSIVRAMARFLRGEISVATEHHSAYTEEQKQAALDDLAVMTYRKASEKHGVPVSTLVLWRKQK